MKIGVIGSGTWGTALAILLAGNQHEVVLWSKLPEEIAELQEKRTHRNLPGVQLPESIAATADLGEACREQDVLVLSVPSVFVRSTAEEMRPYIRDGQVIVAVAKGIEENTLYTMTEIVEEVLPQADVAVLSGPSHAEEVARGIPTTIVVGAHTERTARMLQDVFMNEVFRVYINPDIIGIEVGAALKNVIALAAGMADGLGYGDNTKAALITRGIAEITRLGLAMHCQPETFSGLTCIGDLIVTCASMHSRNRRAGILMGQGKSMEEATREVGMVVEGIYAAKSGLALAEKYGVSMPIVEEVNAILFHGKPAAEAVKNLMLRDRTLEHPALSF